jgi:hypothetical protein
MKTKFGQEAQNGDYVIVLDVDYVHRSATTYIAKVYNNKAYTGYKMNYNRGTKYIHKLEAQVVIPESVVDEETKALIEEDIKIHMKGDK